LLKDVRAKVLTAPLSPGDEKKLLGGELPNASSTGALKKLDQMLLRAYTTGFTSFFG
jgi:hypothetical protein